MLDELGCFWWGVGIVRKILIIEERTGIRKWVAIDHGCRLLGGERFQVSGLLHQSKTATARGLF
jgi:hypothetical protein